MTKAVLVFDLSNELEKIQFESFIGCEKWEDVVFETLEAIRTDLKFNAPSKERAEALQWMRQIVNDLLADRKLEFRHEKDN